MFSPEASWLVGWLVGWPKVISRLYFSSPGDLVGGATLYVLMTGRSALLLLARDEGRGVAMVVQLDAASL
jgi:hypothetical protein